MNSIKVLDCTLRDGGWINNFEFGRASMTSIVNGLEKSGVEYIELGYIDKQKGSPDKRSFFDSMEAIYDNGLLENRKPDIEYLAMIDMGKYPFEELPEKSERTADGIRLCFHKKDYLKALSEGQKIIDKGYDLLIQPMVCTRYSTREYKELIRHVNDMEGVSAFYIVDSFGIMKPEDIKKKLHVVDNNLSENIKIGLHAHNNMNLAFENAITVAEVPLRHQVMLDSTLMGMGKGPGNLCTEEIAAYLDSNFYKSYDVELINDIVSREILVLKKNYKWGYSREYMLSAKYRLTSSYAKALYREYHFPIEEVEEILSQIPEEKKDSFDRIFLENLLEERLNSGNASEQMTASDNSEKQEASDK